MRTSIHILNASGVFQGVEVKLRKEIQAACRTARRKLDLGNIDIVVGEARNKKILENMHGIGGYCPSEYYVELMIDPSHPSVRNALSTYIRASLFHELNHASRWRAGVQFDTRLIDILISEGLADHFVHEVTDMQTVWTKRVQGEQLTKLLRRAKKEFFQKAYSYEDWFIVGSKTRSIPRWAGYAIGYYLVGEFMKKTQKTVVEIMDFPADRFIKE